MIAVGITLLRPPAQIPASPIQALGSYLGWCDGKAGVRPRGEEYAERESYSDSDVG